MAVLPGSLMATKTPANPAHVLAAIAVNAVTGPDDAHKF
jgi:hypothetical protein